VLELSVLESDLNQADKRSIEVGVMNGSRTQGQGNVAGFIGEILTARTLGVTIDDTFQYDLKYKDLKIDVKTKSCSSPPKPNYLCSVMSYQLKNDTDGYIFARVNIPARRCWILGYISKQDLLEKGKFCKKGEPDGSFFFKEDCWSIEISQLTAIETLCENSQLSTERTIRF
jgi:hypothetical protein